MPSFLPLRAHNVLFEKIDSLHDRHLQVSVVTSESESTSLPSGAFVAVGAPSCHRDVLDSQVLERSTASAWFQDRTGAFVSAESD